MSYAKIVALAASAARPPLPLRSKAYLRASSSSRKRSGGRSGAERGRRARAGGRPRRRRPFHRPRSRAPSQQEEQGEKATDDGGRREAEPAAAGLSVNLEAPWERAGGRWRCRAGVRAGAFLEWRAFFFFFSSFLSRDVGRDGLGGTPAPALPQPLTVTLSPFGARATLSLALSAWSHLVTASVVRAPSPSPPPPSSPSSAASCVVLGLLSPCTASCHCQPLTLPRARSLHFCCCCQSRSVVLVVGWMEEERSENWFNW